MRTLFRLTLVAFLAMIGVTLFPQRCPAPEVGYDTMFKYHYGKTSKKNFPKSRIQKTYKTKKRGRNAFRNAYNRASQGGRKTYRRYRKR